MLIDDGTVQHVQAMQMYFNTITNTDFLVKGLHINAIYSIILSMLFTMCITIAYEAVKFAFDVRRLHASRDSIVMLSRHRQNISHFVTTLYKTIAVALGYLVMLIVMSMNIWLFASIILGHALGHIFIRPLLARRLQNTFHDCDPKTVQETMERQRLSGTSSSNESLYGDEQLTVETYLTIQKTSGPL